MIHGIGTVNSLDRSKKIDSACRQAAVCGIDYAFPHQPSDARSMTPEVCLSDLDIARVYMDV